MKVLLTGSASSSGTYTALDLLAWGGQEVGAETRMAEAYSVL